MTSRLPEGQVALAPVRYGLPGDHVGFGTTVMVPADGTFVARLKVPIEMFTNPKAQVYAGVVLVTPGNMDEPAMKELLQPPIDKYLK